jgi:nucleoside-diphosphate-sugar epimerase
MAHLAAVTGGTGFVASELIKQLLTKGWTVRATVRSETAGKVRPLLALADALPGNLEIFEADLLVPGSFDAAFAGCRYVFHTASPFFITAKDPQQELVDVAVKGTRNVLRCAAKAHVSGTLRRVVVTSSCAAVKGMKPNPPGDGRTVYDESDWNDTSTIEGGEAYWLGKVLAERAAWEEAENSGLDLVAILPEFIMGPLLSIRPDGTSAGWMKRWVEGKFQGGAPVLADVRDVARAHVLAAEAGPEAKGQRYIVAAAASTPARVIRSWLKEAFPDAEFDPPAEGPEVEAAAKEESTAVVNPGKVQRDLGLSLTPVKETVIDMAVTMVKLGLAMPRRKNGPR